MRFILLFICFSFNVYCQEILDHKEVYSVNNLTYRIDNNQLFTGKIQKLKKKNHTVFEVEFLNGILIKNTTYFNGEEKIIAVEKFYDSERRIIKQIKYSLDNNYLWITHFQ
jgi:antitoxin component YwqK of YwqJK toxin-antitoxin module